jgi:hypothetical protein
MRKCLAFIALAFWALAAGAEDVRIRSGEHAGFSRLVLEFGERPPWSLRLGDRRATVLLGPGNRRLDAGDVFARIPRTRIRAVTPTADGLELILGCDCAVTAFEVRGAALAIDVADAQATPEVLRNVAPTAATGNDATEMAAPEVAVAALPILPPGMTEAPVVGAAEAGAPVRPPRPALPVAPAPDAAPARPAGDGGRGRVLTELTAAIARATTQGNLRLAATPPEVAAVPPEALFADPALANLRLRLPGEEAWLPDRPAAGANCRDPSSFDVASWVPGDRSPADAIATLQASLAPDLDTIDEARAVALARLYVGLGFGAEARAVLAALAPGHPETALLGDMARIVDGEPVRSDALSGEAGCPGRAQLWVALATGKEAEARDIIVAIGELPVALRRQLAPRVMSRLATEGDAFAAETVRGTIDRAEGPHGASFTLAAAEVEAQRDGKPDLAAIRDLAAGHAPAADEALAVLLELARETGERLDGATLARAETRAQDLRGTDLGLRLEIGLIHAFLRTDEFARAAAWLAKLIAAEAIPPDSMTALSRDFFIALGAGGSEEALLVHAAGFADSAAAFVQGDPAGETVAARLVALGLPDLAARYLPVEPIAPGARRLAARARLAAGDAEGALALATGLDPRDPDTARLRADALRLLAAPEADQNAAAEPPDSGQGSDATAAGGSARARVEASEAARREIDALLAAAPRP